MCVISGIFFALCLLACLTVGVSPVFAVATGLFFAFSLSAANGTKRREEFLDVYAHQNPSGVHAAGTMGFIGLCDNGTTLFVATRSRSTGQIVGTKLGPRDIIEAHISSDSRIVSHTSGGSTAGKALVGGLIAGPVGAIVGASGSRTTRTVSNSQQVNIVLTVVINSMQLPMVQLNFNTMPAAEEWMARIRVLMSRATP